MCEFRRCLSCTIFLPTSSTQHFHHKQYACTVCIFVQFFLTISAQWHQRPALERKSRTPLQSSWTWPNQVGTLSRPTMIRRTRVRKLNRRFQQKHQTSRLDPRKFFCLSDKPLLSTRPIRRSQARQSSHNLPRQLHRRAPQELPRSLSQVLALRQPIQHRLLRSLPPP